MAWLLGWVLACAALQAEPNPLARSEKLAHETYGIDPCTDAISYTLQRIASEAQRLELSRRIAVACGGRFAIGSEQAAAVSSREEAMTPIDKARWKLLSPLLDQLLDLEPAERSARLDQMRSADPVLAAELEALLAANSAAQRDHFLEGSMPAQAQDKTIEGPASD